MKINLTLLIVFSTLLFARAQHDIENFKVMVDTTIQKTVPLITVEDLKDKYSDFIILDTREEIEYQTSHLKGAKHVGYKKFKLKKSISDLDKNKTIVVYCSIGYRSEKIAEKLQRKGFTVYNLYGGIFDWKNKNNSVLDQNEEPTEKVHTYNEEWGKWLLNGEKIYKKIDTISIEPSQVEKK